MNLVNKHKLKVGDQIITNGDGVTVYSRNFTATIKKIDEKQIIVDKEDGPRGWFIYINNEECFLKRIPKNYKEFNKRNYEDKKKKKVH